MSPQQQPSPIPNCLHKKPSSVPDFILTAFSLFVLFSSPKPNTLIHKFSPPISIPRNSRRFLRIPSMSSSSPYNRRFQGRQFATPQSLSDWLNPRLPSDSFASWGVKPGTKNVHNLWLELSEGETSLEDSTPPVRTVEVVIVRVRGKHNRILVESHQELSDGSIRNRCRPLSEKMKPGESFESAAVRAVREELGSAIPIFEDGVTVRIELDSYIQKVEERLSVSYPGLPAHYILHSVDAWIDGLPEDEFSTEEEAEYEENRVADEAIFCKKHHWKWIEIDGKREECHIQIMAPFLKAFSKVSCSPTNVELLSLYKSFSLAVGFAAVNLLLCLGVLV